LRIDEDVLTWFKKQGTGYQTRINSLLKAYKEAHQNKSDRTTV
ncbi:MAG: BrnA antitoxin family protein, partial [Deltaproteobacteria bacterium]|nr:BrnA antitoxin family protein [Deltaproteobacteria bacterium]